MSMIAGDGLGALWMGSKGAFEHPLEVELSHFCLAPLGRKPHAF